MFVLFIVFCTAVALQLVFFLLFLIGFRKKAYLLASGPTSQGFREARPDMQESKSGSNALQPITVIVCAHDEEQNLRELIPQLLTQEYPRFEVIIVDDRSNDGTYDLLLQETKKDQRLRLVKVDRLPDQVNGKKYGITLAIKAATYDWVLLTDADCRPASTRWLYRMAERCDEHAEIVLGYSPYTKENGLLNLFIRFETLFTAIQYFSFAQLSLPYMGVGRNLAYRKSLFLENKGFNGYLRVTGGDDDLFINEHASGSNTRICMGEESLVYSKPKQTLAAFFKQKVRHLAVGRRYKLRDRLILGIFMVSFGVTWFGGFTLVAMQSYLLAVASLLAVRSGLLVITVHQASQKLGHKFEVWAVPFLDFLFLFYYISTGPVALVSKKVKWKT